MQRLLGGTDRATAPAAEPVAGEFEIESAQLHDVRREETADGEFRYLVVLVDSRDGSALLVSDRFGSVPAVHRPLPGGGRAFASSLDVLRRQFPQCEYRLDEQALYAYVYHQMIPSPLTVYRDCAKLGPAAALRLDSGGAQETTHWQPDFADVSRAGERELTAELKRLLAQSLARSDRDPAAACFLSGGIDSSTVCGLLRDRRGRDVDAYSIGFDVAGYNEMDYARITARHFGLNLHEEYISPDHVADAVGVIAAQYDEPFGNSSAVAVWRLASIARGAGVRLLLAGDGGDEIFGGNERYAKQKVFDAYQMLPGLLRATLEGALRVPGVPASSWPLSKVASYISQAKVPMPQRIESYNFLEMTAPASVFPAEFLAAVDPAAPREELRRRYAAAPAARLVDRMLYLDWKFTLADNDLRKVSRMCEVGGVDVAYPFLDDDLVDFAVRLPAAQKVRRLRLRHFFKNAMSDYLPRETIEKTKHGFSLPFGMWLAQGGRLAELTHSSIASLKKRSIFRTDFIERLVQQHRAEDAAHYGKLIWLMLILENWLQAHERAAGGSR